MTDPQETSMTSKELALEVQLRCMAPVDLSADAQANIASRLDRGLISHLRVRWAGAIAAGVLVAITLLILKHDRRGQPVPRSIQARNSSALPVNSANDKSQFAIAAYSNALSQSPASLDAILYRQSRETENDKLNDSRIPRVGDPSITTP